MANQLGQLTSFSSGQKLVLMENFRHFSKIIFCHKLPFLGKKKVRQKKEFTKICHNCLRYERVLN
jgi:hypothetical protein